VRQKLDRSRKELEAVRAERAAFEAANEQHRLGQEDDTRGRLAAERERLAGLEMEFRAFEKQLEDVREQLSEEPEWLEADGSSEDSEGAEGARKRNPMHVELKKSELEVLSALTVKRKLRSDYQARVDALENRMAEFPKLQAQWVELQAKESTLQTRVEELGAQAKVAEGECLERVARGTLILQIVVPPEYPLRPLQQKRALFWGAGLLIGLGLGVVIVLVRDALDRSFRSAGEVSAATDVPVLGSVSKIETLGEREMERKKERFALAAVVLLVAMVGAGVFFHVSYDAEISSLVDSALMMVK
jgi:uncharacterized protein involved in exopolysaccharide biosynthesis